jgi:hypothetical protein
VRDIQRNGFNKNIIIFINGSELGTTFDPSLKDNITVYTACLVQPDGKLASFERLFKNTLALPYSLDG